MCYNAAKSWQIGWYNDRKVMLSPTTQSNSYTTTVTMMGVADYQYSTNISTPVVLKLETNTDQDYFIGFNRAIGINADNKQADDEIIIVQTDSGHGEVASQSWLRATLQVGEQYTISNFGCIGCGTHVVVKFDNIIINNSSSGGGGGAAAAAIWKANITVSNVRSDTAPPTIPSHVCPTPKPNTPNPTEPTL